MRKALHAALADARRWERMTLEHEVRALLAERLADTVDRAARESDTAGLRAASRDLLEVLDTLPVRVAEGGVSGDGGSARGQLLRIMDGGPTVGDTANT